MKLKSIIDNLKIKVEDKNNNNSTSIDYDIIHKYTPKTFLMQKYYEEWAEKVKNEILKITKNHFSFLKEVYGQFIYIGVLKNKKTNKLLHFSFSIPKGETLSKKPILLKVYEEKGNDIEQKTIQTDLKNFLKNALYLTK